MKKYDIAAYVWPAYGFGDKRSRLFWEQGMGEWQSVMSAGHKFEGDRWPRMPLWGYINEADPYVMAMEIKAASDHGINVFAFDWYWYDDRPFLEDCLNKGFLKAKNNDKMKFYIMWANHDAGYLWDKRISDSCMDTAVLWRGACSKESFLKAADRLINKYLLHPLYYRIDGKPVISIYDLGNLINGLGGVEDTVWALSRFREEAGKRGISDIHFQLIDIPCCDICLDGKSKAVTPELLARLGIRSATNYQFVHIADANRDYEAVVKDVQKYWAEAEQKLGVRYYPHVSAGWNNNPRFQKLRDWNIYNSTPDKWKQALIAAKAFADERGLNLITVNSWNEWTESSYLMPDNIWGYQYLEAVKEVFLQGGEE